MRKSCPWGGDTGGLVLSGRSRIVVIHTRLPGPDLSKSSGTLKSVAGLGGAPTPPLQSCLWSVLRGSGTRDFLEREGTGMSSRSTYSSMGNEEVGRGV